MIPLCDKDAPFSPAAARAWLLRRDEPFPQYRAMHENRTVRNAYRRGLCRTTWYAIAAALTFVWPACQAANSVADAPSIASFIKIRWPTQATLAPDSALYYVYDPQGTYQLFKVPPGETQQNAVALTEFVDGLDSYVLSPDGAWAAVTASRGGSEQSDLFLLDTRAETLQPLYESPDVVYGDVVWQRDSSAFAYRANDDSPSDFHVYVFDLESRTSKKVMEAAGYHYPADFNKNGERLLVGKVHSATHSQIFEVTIATATAREVTPPGDAWTFDPVGYFDDDRRVLTTSNYRRDLKSVLAIELESGSIEDVLPESGQHEVDFATLAPDRDVVAVTVNQSGYRELFLYDLPGFVPAERPDLEKGVVGNIQFVNHWMLYAMTNARTPGIVYRWDRSQPAVESVPLTRADMQGIDTSKFRLPELVHYPSVDGRSIPAFLYLPPDGKPDKTIPFLMYYHGGPESQFRPEFIRSFQYFLSRGYGIVAPNVRGSSGYGKEYVEADNYKNRRMSVQDGVAAAHYVIHKGYSQTGRLGAWGGSYGGFMVMAVITEAPELFGAACNIVGIVNFETFLRQTKDYRRHLREAEYGPLSDPDFLRSISPIHRVDRIQAPLMVAHGLNDPRVPVGEAMQVAVALKQRGVEVEQLYFPDEGHGFAKEENRLLFYEELARFFLKHLPPD